MNNNVEPRVHTADYEDDVEPTQRPQPFVTAPNCQQCIHFQSKKPRGTLSEFLVNLGFIGTVGTIMGIWAWACIIQETFIHFDASDVTLLAAVFSGKTLDSKLNHPANTTSSVYSAIDEYMTTPTPQPPASRPRSRYSSKDS